MYIPRTKLSTSTEIGWVTEIDYLERTATTLTSGLPSFGVQCNNLSKGQVHIKNLKSINSVVGYGNS